MKSALRSASVRWPPRYTALADAFRGQQTNKATGRLAKHYQCARCKNLFPLKEVEVNHISPVIPISGFDSWDNVIERMLCEKEGFEVLCKTCHKKQTKLENLLRKHYG